MGHRGIGIDVLRAKFPRLVHCRISGFGGDGPRAHTVHRGDVIAKDWYKGVASPIRFERTKASLRRLPPKFSEHSTAVLTEFG
jgi:crotonobetainyl-CoA:carnitine CoA-transferase CaiB-like acyl-CoA transferase